MLESVTRYTLHANVKQNDWYLMRERSESSVACDPFVKLLNSNEI